MQLTQELASDGLLAQALETGAGSLLALEAMRVQVQRIGDLDSVEAVVRAAMELVHGALEELSRHAGEEHTDRPAIGFVKGTAAAALPQSPGTADG